MLYFIPDAKAMSAGLLAEHGLDRLLIPSSHRETLRGPGGQAGLIVGDNTLPPDRLRYDEQKQTWSPRFGLTSLVGTHSDHPITPEKLARPQQLPGEEITLLDGRRWRVPLLRKWEDDEQLCFRTELPRVVQQSPETGRFILGEVVPQYRSLWQRSLAIGQYMMEQLQHSKSAELDDDEIHQFACDLLAVNYRVDASVLSHLRLLTPELLGAILRSALDWDTLRAHLKNRLSRLTSGGTNTESGETLPTEV